MGQAKQRKERFFAQHPICCFCGGGAKATTQDHWPPRSFFLGRIWPEDHVFPACQRCNSASRIHEMLFALICRIRFGPAKVGITEDAGYAEWLKNAQGVARVLPDVYRSMLLSVTEKRSRMRQIGIRPDPGRTTRDVPIISIDHPEFAEAAKTITRKLFCALYYFRTGKILGPGGGIVSFWTTNAHSMEQLLNADTLRPMLAQFPPIRRGGDQLDDQFACAYTIAEVDPPSALFAVQFNDAVVMLGAAFGDISQCAAFEQVPEIANHQVFPYRWE